MHQQQDRAARALRIRQGIGQPVGSIRRERPGVLAGHAGLEPPPPPAAEIDRPRSAWLAEQCVAVDLAPVSSGEVVVIAEEGVERMRDSPKWTSLSVASEATSADVGAAQVCTRPGQ